MYEGFPGTYLLPGRNAMNIVYSIRRVFDLVNFFLVRALCKLAVKVHNEAVVCFLFFREDC